MALHFEYSLRPDLPRLAWVLEYLRGDDTIRVVHGPWVETRPTFFSEGGWRGPFSRGALDRSDLTLGSGARLLGDRFVISTPSHSLDRLQSLTTKDGLFVSNSLPFLLAVSGQHCDDRYPYYDIDLMAFLDGLPSAVSSIPLRDSRRIDLFYCTNLTIDRDLRTTPEQKPNFGVRPMNYQEYWTFLREMVRDVSANLSDSDRSILYRPLATLSSGYDSPACAVLATTVGCREAATFTSARSNFEESADSGGRIGERLGLKVHTFERDEYLGRTDQPEVEFLSVGTGGEDVVMAALEHILPNTLLFTGFLGDTVWGLTGSPEASSRYRMTYPAGSSATEFRLRVGFVHFPVPQSHHRLHPWIERISCSPEMAPWRLGRDYDRPIPRRIAEEAGVPREWFGVSKKAITQPFYQGDSLKELFSPTSYEQFRSFCLERGLLGKDPGPTRLPAISYLVDLAQRASWRLTRNRVGWWKLIRRIQSDERAYTFHWAVHLMKERYQSALGPEYSSIGRP